MTANLNRQPGTQQITDIEASLVNAQTASANATTLNTQTQNTLQDMLQGIEGVDQNKIGVEILNAAEQPFGVDVGDRPARANQPGQLLVGADGRLGDD